MTDNELLLVDRIDKIRAINEQLDLEHKAYLSFSGGKDSTCLHYLLDMALPGNKIPRVFIDTGIEYQEIRNFVKSFSSDERFVYLKPSTNIKLILEEYGYPFKSKEHSLRIEQYRKHNGDINSSKYLRKYFGLEDYNSKFKIPKCLKYQTSEDFKLKISNKCCLKLKKEPLKLWAKENNKIITLTGMTRDEGGNRVRLNCITNDGKSFHPLVVTSKEWIDWFINEHNIKLCKLYYTPFSFERTGCKGCPFSLTLQKQLDIMGELLPHERKQCESIWEPVYKEYRRLGYRLRKEDYKQ